MRRMLTPSMLLCFAFATIGCNGKDVLTGDEKLPLVDFLTMRNYAESVVGQAKTKFKDDATKLATAERMYSQAAAQGNAFIELVQAKLTARSLSDADLRPAADRLKTALQSLDDYVVHDGKPPMTRPLALDWIAQLIDGVTKAAVTIWTAVKDEEARVINETKAELEKRRWKSWSAIVVQ